MTFQNLRKSTKYITATVFATIIIAGFSAAPALATTTSFPPYSTAIFFHGNGCSNNYQTSASPSGGNEYSFAASTPTVGCGQASVTLVSSGISLPGGDTLTLSQPSAGITGTLYVDPSGGRSADVQVVAYVSTASNCATNDGSNQGIGLLNKLISSGSWSTNQVYLDTVDTTSITNFNSSPETVYVCGYLHTEGTGGFSYADFGSSGTSNGVTNFVIYATY